MRVRRLGLLVAAGLLPVGLQAAAAPAGTSTTDAGILSTGSAAGGTPVSFAETHTLDGGPGGSIQVVINDGNFLVANASTTTTLSGFTVPGAPFTAKATPFFAGGQCGPAVPPPGICAGFPTGGSGDSYVVGGGASTLSWGPDAVRGAAGCPWGMDTCLWDNPTKNVSAAFAPGDTSGFVGVSSSNISDAADCINHVAQVFAVGPTAAWGSAGYVVDGEGLANRFTGILTIAGIPVGSVPVKALLFWTTRGFGPSPTMLVNGVPVAAELVGTAPSTCWTGSGTSFAYRADVTPLVTGNGVFVLSGFPFGTGLNNPPWIPPSTYPRADGAGMAVFYQRARGPQHFLRYQLAQPEFSGETVTLVDQFAAREVRLQEAEWLWNPAAKARTGRPAEEIQRDDEHLVCYGLPYIPTADRFVDVRNQFVESSTLRVGRPLTLCAPASKSLAPEPGPPPEDLDHYLCYDVRGEAPTFVSETLVVRDQFGERTVRIDRTRELCNPVEKRRVGREPELRIRPEEHFVCYRITTQTPLFGPRDVFTSDQFFTDLRRVSTLERLCVPSTKTDRPVDGLASGAAIE